MSSKNAKTPSANATDLFSSTVANIDHRAMVTTKSKAFILERVRFPETRSKRIRQE
jgi:hypothetical protein